MVAAQVAVFLAVLLGVTALALDGGIFLTERRHAQATADAAAMAAAAVLYQNFQSNNGNDTGGSARSAAFSIASANGFTNDGTTNTVNVNLPATNGSPNFSGNAFFVGKAGYAEVMVEWRQTRRFSAIFGGGNVPIRARAVARGVWGSGNAALLLLDPHASGALNAHGNGATTVTGGDIVVDSDAGAAALTKGANASLSAAEFDITGGYSGSLSGGPINTGVPPMPDPLAYLPEPDPATLTPRQVPAPDTNGNIILLAGVYAGPLSFTGNNIIMTPSGSENIIYITGGGLSLKGNASLTANGVMIFNAPSGSIDLAGNGSVTISPPTSGIYQGISIFQDRSSTAGMSITGNGTVTLSGTIYAANSAVKLAGNGAASQYGGQWIARTMDLGGNGATIINYNANQSARQRQIGLVE
jgi:hypothetical protein